jgi:hypothetical protein
MNDFIPRNAFMGHEPIVRTGGFSQKAGLFQTMVVYELLAALVEMRLFMQEVKQAAAIQDSRESRPLVLARKEALTSHDISLRPAIASMKFLKSFKRCLKGWFEKKEYIYIPPTVFGS